MPDDIASRYPALFARAAEINRTDRIAKAVALIEDGAAGTRTVRAVEFKDATHGIGYAFDSNFFGSPTKGDSVGEAFWYATNTPGNLHDVLAFHKRLIATDAGASAYLAKVKAIAAELNPLAEMARALRPKLVAGRDTSKPKAAPANPDKVTKTCSCCFRQIAVKGGKGPMVKHGYKRPGNGSTYYKCFGQGRPCLEVSTEGLVEFIKFNERSVERAKAALDRVGDREEITLEPRRTEKEPRVVRKGDPEWARHLADLTRSLGAEHASLVRTVAFLKEKLTEWEAVPKITL